MKEKKNKQTPKPGKLPALDSENWVSESSNRDLAPAQSQPADSSGSGSGSGSGGGGAPCYSTNTPPDSVTIKEEAIADGMGPILDLGYTAYKSTKFDTKVFCDGEASQWVRRVVTATFQQEQLIEPRAKAITDNRIKVATCQTLWEMGLSLKLSILNVGGGDDYTPRNIIQAHEKVHQDIDSEDMKTLYDSFVSKINAISVACDGKDFDAAMKATSPAASKAKVDFLNATSAKFQANKAHKQEQRFFNAVRPKAVVWYNKVRNKMIAKRCPNVLPPL